MSIRLKISLMLICVVRRCAEPWSRLDDTSALVAAVGKGVGVKDSRKLYQVAGQSGQAEYHSIFETRCLPSV